MTKMRKATIQVLIICLYLTVTCTARRATHCMDPRPLLDGELFDSELQLGQITSSSFFGNYTPSEVRMSGEGWCAGTSICEIESDNHYLQIDFGAEIVVEAIAIDSAFVTEYYVQYGLDVNELYCVISEEFNGSVFDHDICSYMEMKNFAYPIITRFIRVVPLEWEGLSPCLSLELYGCYVKECSQIRSVNNIASLLPAESIHFSTIFPSQTNISDVWCTRSGDPSPYTILNFTEPVYLLYAAVRGDPTIYYVTNFSFVYENPSVEEITYVNVNGTSFFGLPNADDHTILLWPPINTSLIKLRVYEHTTSYSCIGVNLYGCIYSEVINHASDESTMINEASSPELCADTPVQEPQRSIITITTTVHVIATTVTETVSITPQSSCSFSNQQQASTSSSSDSDVVTICVPIVVIFGVIILTALVVIGFLIWRKMKSGSDKLPYDRVIPRTATVENDLYGLESTFTKSSANNDEIADNGAQDEKEESVKYEYPNTVIQPINLPTVTYETVSLHDEEDLSEKTGSDIITNPVYSEVLDSHDPSDDPALQHNPAYAKITDQS